MSQITAAPKSIGAELLYFLEWLSAVAGMVAAAYICRAGLYFIIDTLKGW